MLEQRNLILAVVLSVAVIVMFEAFRPAPPPTPTVETPAAASVAPAAPGEAAPVPAPAPGDAAAPPAPAMPGLDQLDPTTARDAALAKVERIKIDTPSLHGSISLVGGRIDDLTLVNYHETIKSGSPEVVMLSPSGTPAAYYAEFGWTVASGGPKVPDGKTRWTVAGNTTLSPATPVELTWNNGEGLTFFRRIAIDANYMFTITDRVANASGKAVELFPYGLISRSGTPQTSGFYILHEGPLGVLNGTLTELDYTDLQGETPKVEKTTGGWVGITDKYWLAALIPDQAREVDTRFAHRSVEDKDRYQVDYLGKAVTVESGGNAENAARLFAGAKVVAMLDDYTDNHGVARLDLAIDFGWFYFLTKPYFYALAWLHGVLGNFGLAILAFTVAVKAVLFPLANKSYKSMSKMKKLQPEMKKLQERFADDKVRLNQEMMALYKREGASPVSGCLPIFVQIPVFFALYKVLFVSIEMRQAPFYGWIHDLSAPDPTSLFNLFGLLPFDPPAFLLIGVWPLLMGITMWLQQKLNPQPADPVQAKIMMFLPLIFTFMLASFPVGLVIYWTWNNILSIAQQWVIMRQMGVKA